MIDKIPASCDFRLPYSPTVTLFDHPKPPINTEPSFTPKSHTSHNSLNLG
ncbi:hypothetical protein HanIR_Chr09g0434001 [Helianthus annuus]|nr:hypothetical protein HanIR_Chr09g0434001 [Helianthus annuus]